MINIDKDKKEAEPLIKAIDEAVRKCNELLREIEQYRLNNGLFHPMSELEKYKGRRIICIKLVEKDEDGNLDTKDMWNDGWFSVDPAGHLNYSSYDRGIMSWDEEMGKHYFSYHHFLIYHDFVGYLDVCFEEDEEDE